MPGHERRTERNCDNALVPTSLRALCAPFSVGLTALTLLGMLSTAQPAFARTLLSDNFNSENGGVGAENYNSFANFNVTSGSVDLIGNGFFDSYPGNGLYVDLDDSTNQVGTITSKSAFDLTPGLYDLSFSLGNPGLVATTVATVGLGSLYSETFTQMAGPLTPITRTITVTSATSANLSFASDTPGNQGSYLDTSHTRRA